MMCCTNDEDCCQNPTFTSDDINLGAGTLDIVTTVDLCAAASTSDNFGFATSCTCCRDKCQFCGCDAVKTIYFNSGQRLHLCQKHLDELKNSIGDVIRYIPDTNPWFVPAQPWTPAYPDNCPPWTVYC